MTADLLFCLPPSTADLLFGEQCESAPAPSVQLSVDALLPDVVCDIRAVGSVPLSVDITLPALTCDITAMYASHTDRPLVGRCVQRYQVAGPRCAGWGHLQQDSQRIDTGWQAVWQGATVAGYVCEHRLPHILLPMPIPQRVVWQDGAGRRISCALPHQDCAHIAHQRVGIWQDGAGRRISCALPHQDCAHIAHQRVGIWQEASRRYVWRTGNHQVALLWPLYWLAEWQDARRPPPGVSVVVPPPPPLPPSCYTPSAHLLFEMSPLVHGDLLFVCESSGGQPPAPVIVPIRRVYYVINNVSLRRASDNRVIPSMAVSLDIDVASWAWGFSAAIPAAYESLVTDADWPVELIATINGTEYRVLCESVSRSRSFGSAEVTLSGRGHNAILSAPYAATETRSNVADITAHQLMQDVLTVNGVSLGWTIDWGITDWLVPAGVWSHQGTYIEAVVSIAEAVGAYIQPHASDKTLMVRPLYPVPPWQWGTLTPDIVLPAGATVQESIKRLEKPAYNCVYVSGQNAGVLGRVIRAGTAGDHVAPMVVDALITSADAARQRGISILSDTGRQMEVSLRLPVSDTMAGVITPGAIIDYNSGTATYRGIVRSTRIEAGQIEVWQTIGVQVHA